MNKKKVEVFQTIIKVKNGETCPSFEDILLNKDFQDKTIHGFTKRAQMSYVEDKGDYIVGVIETTQMGPTPPKHNTVTKERSSLGLDTPEGLLYGNVFLYEKATKIFMYEVTKNGTFIGQLDDFFYKLTKDSTLPKYTLNFLVVMNFDAMEKMLRMGSKKVLHMQFANPKALYQKVKNSQSGLKDIAKNGTDFGAEVIDVTYKMQGRKKKSLHNNTIDKMLNYLKQEKDLLKEHFEYVKIRGYEDDSDTVTEVDLIKDKMIKFISYSEARNMIDIRPKERKDDLIRVYEGIANDLNKYFLDDTKQT